MGNSDFGEACRSIVVQKIARRQANWRLDPPLRKACKADVASFCAGQDEKRSEKGLVKACLVQHHAEASRASGDGGSGGEPWRQARRLAPGLPARRWG